jgi:hypothetical protein
VVNGVVPRLLTRTRLRAYLHDLKWAEIDARMKRGQLPGPLWGIPADHPDARWDRRAVDRALDAASGIPASIEVDEAALDRALGIR